MRDDEKAMLYLSLRSFLDRVIALILLIITLPVMLLIAITIQICMGAPVLFYQERIGYKGRVFRIIKFRTMINNAEQIGGGYISPDLNLVPPLGSFLRKTSLDELPQLINILKGDMSFVGPRPALPEHFQRYTPKQARRVTVPQGITGLAQVRYRNDATWSVRIDSDLEYIENLGPAVDLSIWWATLNKVIRREGVRLDQIAQDVDDLGPQKEEKDK